MRQSWRGFRFPPGSRSDEAIRRGIARDGTETEGLYQRRYAPGQRLYLEAVRPAELADVIVDNSDPERPVLSPGGAGARP
ncbi:MAG: hypothetical protein H0W87_03475 [Actinobacteria bacterium]|nr:hypothetical protein [Actinomycetota bacterium]